MSNSSDVTAHAGTFLKGNRSFLGPGSGETWYGTHSQWHDAVDLKMINLRESGHPLFRGTSALFRRTLKINGGGKTSIHCNADPATAELLFRKIVSDNRLSFYGAVADWRAELPQ